VRDLRANRLASCCARADPPEATFSLSASRLISLHIPAFSQSGRLLISNPWPIFLHAGPCAVSDISLDLPLRSGCSWISAAQSRIVVESDDPFLLVEAARARPLHLIVPRSWCATRWPPAGFRIPWLRSIGKNMRVHALYQTAQRPISHGARSRSL